MMANDESSEIIINQPLHEKGILINFNEKTFADMILNFLGTKQKLSYHIENEYFKVSNNDLAQFYYYLEQKIDKEQFTTVNNFSISILYNDNTKLEINGVKELLTVNETRDIIPVSIVMTWNIILQFPNKQIVENQIIDVSFNLLDKGYGEILLNIEHTNQAWGTEVLYLFKDYIHKLIIPKSTQLKKIEKMRERGILISLLVPLILFLGIMVYLIESDQGYKSSNEIQGLSKIVDIGKQENNFEEILLSFYIIDKKCQTIECIEYVKSKALKKELKNYITTYESNIYNQMKIVFKLVGILVLFGLIVALYINQTFNYFKLKSFILLTEKAKLESKNFDSERSQIKYYSAMAFIIAVISSIVGSIIYKLIE